MTTKLTLTIEKKTIEKAKQYAKGTQRSLSEMVQKYLDSLVEQESKQSINSENGDEICEKLKFPATLQKYVGSAKMPKEYTDEDLENDKREYLEKKHL